MACSQPSRSGRPWLAAGVAAVAVGLLADPCHARVLGNVATKSFQAKGHSHVKAPFDDYTQDEAPPKPEWDEFDHPAPAVQDSEDFDKDFVKDSNSDNGEWNTQSKYDELRHKLVPFAKDLERLEEAVDAAEDVVESDHDALSKAERNHREANDKHYVAEDHRKESEKMIPQWRREIEQTTNDIEDLKQRLKELEKKLEGQKQRLQEAEVEVHGARSAADYAEVEGVQYSKEHESVADRLKRDTKAHHEAESAYKSKKAQYGKLMDEFKEVKAKIAHSRRTEDMEGGVYPVREQKSGASRSPLFAVVAAVAAWFAGAR